jgi:nitronate monooxygenase
MKLANRLTQLLQITYPILSAPMARVAGGALASAVSQAGGLGFIGAGYSNADWLEQQLNIASGNKIGIGFISWRLAQAPELLTQSLSHKPVAIMLSFGDPKPFVDEIKASNAKLICQIQTVKDAVNAVKCGADIIVAQGSEAGGHGAFRGTFSLVPAVVDAVKPVPVIAAGGIADGRGLVGAMALGAEGALMGTRFYASTEALGGVGEKQLLVNTDGDHTIRSSIFDVARGLTWPSPFTARSLQNKFTKKWQHECNLKDKMDSAVRNQYLKACEIGDLSIAGIFAGESIDLIRDIMPVKKIMEEIIMRAELILLPH